MSKSKQFLLFLLFPFLFQCSQSDHEDIQPQELSPDILDAIEKLGLSKGKESIYEFPEYVRIGHITYLKSTILDMANEPCNTKSKEEKEDKEKATVFSQLNHYPYTSHTIYYYVGSVLKNARPGIESWIDDAVSDIESLPQTNLNFQKVYSPVATSSNGINFYHRSEASDCMVREPGEDEGFPITKDAGAMYPGNHQVGGEVMFNPHHLNAGEMALRRTIKHEMGHTLGLLHNSDGSGNSAESPCQAGLYTSFRFPGTSVSGGIMTAFSNNVMDFNADEKYTLEAMYPVSYNSVFANLTNVNTGPFGNFYQANFDVVSSRRSYEFKVRLLKNGNPVSGAQTYYRNGRNITQRIIWKRIPSPGSYTVELTYRNYKGDVSKTIQRPLVVN